MSLVSRTANLLDRINWLAPYAGGRMAAARTLVNFKRDPKRDYPLSIEGTPFYCRRADLQAVREVLVDREYAFLTQFLRQLQEPRILDIGAHIGTFAMWALQVSPRAKILSVEADPDTFSIASRNAAARGAYDCDWTVINCAAASGEIDKVRFAQDGPSMSHRVSATGGVEVKTIDLGGVLNRLGGAADLLKVDIEGSEENFLAVSPSALESVQAIVIELHPRLCDTNRVRRLLSERYDSVEEVPNRMSSKPLLYAH